MISIHLLEMEINESGDGGNELKQMIQSEFYDLFERQFLDTFRQKIRDVSKKGKSAKN